MMLKKILLYGLGLLALLWLSYFFITAKPMEPRDCFDTHWIQENCR